MSILAQDENVDESGFHPAGGWLGAVVEAWDGLIYVGGPDFRIRFMNRRFVETLGRDATGEFCYRALHGREEPCPWCHREVFSGKNASGYFQKPMDDRWYHVSNSPLPLADGTYAKVAFIRECSEPDSLVRELPAFRNIVDRLSDVICFHDPGDGRVLYANDLACSSLGYSREMLLGMRPPDYTEVSESQRPWRDLVSSIETEGVATFEARYRCRDGSIFDVEVKATEVRAGLDRFIVTVARDITERKLAQARMIEERNKVKAVIAATGDGITVQDLDFRIVYQNDVMIGRRGRRLGEYCYSVYANRDRICDNCQAQKSIADGRGHHRSFTTTTPEGRPLHLEIFSHPLRDANGKITACVEVVRDVTVQRKLEQSRDEAFSAVSHEMRTPLTALLGFTQFMQENPTSPEQQQEYLGLMLKEGERLKQLIDNLLSLQRLRAGYGLVNPAPVPLYPILHEVVQHYRSPFVRQQIEVDCALDLPPILGDALKLQEAVTNLLDNAVKYSPAESTITLKAQAEGHRVLLSVRDEGPGIPAEEQERIFERFYQLEGNKRRDGTGLGLALVWEIAHAHGGRVWVESAPGQGSTFCLSLLSTPPRETPQ